MSPTNKLSSLESLEAYIESLKGDTSAALKTLEGFSDPDSVRRRLAILIDNERFEEAVLSIQGLELHEQWVDLATFVHAMTGDLTSGRETLAWAVGHQNLLLHQKTALRFVGGAMHWTFKERPTGSHLAPGSLSDAELRSVREIVVCVQPVCDAMLVRGRVDLEIESQLLQQYLDLNYLIGDRQKASSIFVVLLTRTPLPARMGSAVLQGIARADARLVTRLWDENPKSFDARILSSLILARYLQDFSEAKRRVRSLVSLAQSDQQREDICEALYEFWVNAPVEEFAEIESFTSDLLGANSLVFTLVQVDRLLNSGDHPGALALLETVRQGHEQDARWLRSLANTKIKLGERSEALDVFRRLTSIVASPELLLATASLAKEQGRVEEEGRSLERVLALDPDNWRARRRLAMLFVNAKDYLKAAQHFETLARIDPNDQEVVLNLAVSYAFAGNTQRALQVLTPRADESVLPLRLLLTKALIFQSSGDAKKGLSELNHAKSAYWEEPEFLVAYMDLAYAEGDEREAHQALLKLQELREKGAVDEKLMRMVSIDEVRKWLEDAAKRHDFIRRNIVQGKVPWIMAAQIQGEVPYWAWLLKTQALDWVWDDPLNRASYCVYSTNSFRALERDPVSTFEYIECPRKGTPVVIDLTALITLHGLGLLGEAAEFFGSIYVPAVYLSQVLEDTRKLLPHQRSQRDAAQAILFSVTNRRIAVLPSETDTGGQMPVIDEYTAEKEGARPHLALSDLIDALGKAGFLNEQEMNDARAVAHRPASTDAQLALGQSVVIAGSSLVTLHGLGLLEVVTHEFGVHILKSDYDECVARSRAFESLQEAHAKHTELWSALRNDGRIVFATAPAQLRHEKDRSEDSEAEDARSEKKALALASYDLARERNFPLFVDDRVSQMLILNERKKEAFAAFGTDAFLIAANRAGLLEGRKAAQFFLKLMEWRYRFVLMPPEFLKSLADQYRSSPPGLAMRRVAKYVHDSMSDVGLFAGLEQTSPPTSVAVRLYQSWAQNVSELAMDIWMDKTVSETYAEEFTSWAIAELLPSPPRVLDERMQARICSLTTTTVLTRALIRSSASTDFDRVNLALRSISSALGMSDADYFEVVAKVITATNE